MAERDAIVFHDVLVCGSQWHVPAACTELQLIYGDNFCEQVRAKYLRQGEGEADDGDFKDGVIIKRASIAKRHDTNDYAIATRAAFNEIRLLRLCQERCSTLSIFTSNMLSCCPYLSYEHVYIITPLANRTLLSYVYDQFTDDHVKYIMYQLLTGLNFLHSAGIAHCGLTPSVVSMTSECSITINTLGTAANASCIYQEIKRKQRRDQYSGSDPQTYDAPEVIFGAACTTG